ncbi:flagellar assembly protein FliH [Hylemonella gracilis str. Niagara R]|uniref:Flagellar assembly protein FliH n=1 Tax=Hylemonella gracilis str. Niagara R TaxID=1458275 RepID=A0A016XDJ1_9BURK|nr:FliH/SctL family protein [Hylemonella gracilis]EYC49627.1 flagellar assembly protein FliH [Hylemonella gracilis str. Niagara R]
MPQTNSRTGSRFIPSEEINQLTRWDFNDVDEAGLLLAQQAREREEQALLLEQQAYEEAIFNRGRDQGYSEGYAAGFEQGKAQAQAEGQKQLSDYISTQGQVASRQFGALMAATNDQLEAAQQMAAQSVLELACELARQVLRKEIAGNPNALLPVIREALGQLFADVRAAQLRLHPLDLEMLQDVLLEEYPNLKLTLQPDAALSRGGCIVEAAGTVIDGRLEKRWLRAIGRLGQSMDWEEDAPRNAQTTASKEQESGHGRHAD